MSLSSGCSSTTAEEEGFWSKTGIGSLSLWRVASSYSSLEERKEKKFGSSSESESSLSFAAVVEGFTAVAAVDVTVAEDEGLPFDLLTITTLASCFKYLALISSSLEGGGLFPRFLTESGIRERGIIGVEEDLGGPLLEIVLTATGVSIGFCVFGVVLRKDIGLSPDLDKKEAPFGSGRMAKSPDPF